MRILLTNHGLAERAGTELWIRDIALALLARGHQPIAYSRTLGEVADELRRSTVPVLDDLRALAEPPDLIHAHHHLEAMTALCHFPRTPAIYVCHGWLPDEEAPPRHPRIARYIAVDALVRQRLTDECGLPDHAIETRLNFVDLERFRPRTEPLPRRPERALVLSHQATDQTFLPALRAACDVRGITLDVVGRGSGQASPEPEALLPRYDVVFAKGRSALEAAAVGAAVILCDRSGLGPMVTRDTLDHLRAYNFGVRLLDRPVTAEAVADELARYDADDATAVRDALRREIGLAEATEWWIDLYRRMLADFDPSAVDPDADARAVSRYLRVGPLRGGDLFRFDRDRLRAELERAATWASGMEAELLRAREALADQGDARVEQAHTQAALGAMTADRDRLADRLARAEAEVDRRDHDLEASARRIDDLERELAWIRGSATWRWRRRLVGLGRRLRPGKGA